jgi:hypothetical protein
MGILSKEDKMPFLFGSLDQSKIPPRGGGQSCMALPVKIAIFIGALEYWSVGTSESPTFNLN